LSSIRVISGDIPTRPGKPKKPKPTCTATGPVNPIPANTSTTLTVIQHNGKGFLAVNLDRMFEVHLNFLKNTKCETIAMAQGGDMIGGAGNLSVVKGYKRKAMNSFFCDIERPFMFRGTLNEDVNYYVNGGVRGILILTLYGWMLDQETTQQSGGGLTEIYLDGGTYFKSFYSVIFSPNNVKIGKIGNKRRIHHKINGKYTNARIIDKKYKYNTYDEIHSSNEEW